MCPGFPQANEPTAKPYTQEPIPVRSGVSGQIDRLIEPPARADLFSDMILVQPGDHVVFQPAYGFASWELRVANNKHTRFGIASITKPMTEALVSVLVQQHQLDLQAPVERVHPGIPPWRRHRGKPTIEQLLKHCGWSTASGDNCRRRDAAAPSGRCCRARQSSRGYCLSLVRANLQQRRVYLPSANHRAN